MNADSHPEELRQMRLTCMANRTANRAMESADRQRRFIDKCLDVTADCSLDNDEFIESLQALAQMVGTKDEIPANKERKCF